MKTNFRTVALRLLAVSALVAAAGCSGSGPADPNGQQAPTAEVGHVDGLTVYRGVFFGEGPIADRLPETWGAEARAQRTAMTESPERAAETLQGAIARMKADNWSPALIAQAEQSLAELRSGAPVPQAQLGQESTVKDLVVARIAEDDPTFFGRYAADMQSGNHVRVDNAMQEATGKTKEALKIIVGSGGINAVDSKLPVWGPVVVAVAVAIAAVAVLVVFIEDPTEQSGSRLGHAVAIDNLTNHLKG
jgi:SdpC family antimicrobial peptide